MSCKAMDGEGFVTLSEESTADQNDDISASEGNDLCIRRLRGLGKTVGVLKYLVKIPFL